MLVTPGLYKVKWSGLSYEDPLHYPAMMFFDGSNWINPCTGRPGQSPADGDVGSLVAVRAWEPLEQKAS